MLHARALLSALVMAILVGVAGGCVNELEITEDAPIDTFDNVDLQGVYDCSERGDRGYSNGNGFNIRVVRVDGRPMQRDTANAYIAMQARAKRAGVNLRVVSGFRTMDEQEYLYGCYTNCSCNSCNLAARPGYSNHQSGHALDLNTADSGVLRWLNAHADEFGFRRTVPSEDWHWEYWGAVDFDGPCGVAQPACWSGDFNGAYCDDEGSSSARAHDRLLRTLDVDYSCRDIQGEPAFCPGKTATRADAMFVLGKAADLPTRGRADAFRDDEGHRREAWLNAGAAVGVMRGSDGRIRPDGALTRSTLAIMLARLYALPEPARDFFDDDDGSSAEAAHNKVAAAGLMLGSKDRNGGRRDFKGKDKATRSTLALVAVRAFDKRLVPVWRLPQTCVSGHFDGSFCDDDGQTHEADNDAFQEAGVNLSCTIAGERGFCGGRQVTRAELVYALGTAADMPAPSTLRDAFDDDDGHRYERFLNAAKAFGLYLGYENGTEVRPDGKATRGTLATVLCRMYVLPESNVDAFSDDNGTSGAACHDRLAAAGLFTGSDDGRGGRSFKADGPATRSTLAIVFARASAAGLTPTWLRQQTSLSAAANGSAAHDASATEDRAGDDLEASSAESDIDVEGDGDEAEDQADGPADVCTAAAAAVCADEVDAP